MTAVWNLYADYLVRKYERTSPLKLIRSHFIPIKIYLPFFSLALFLSSFLEILQKFKSCDYRQ